MCWAATAVVGTTGVSLRGFGTGAKQAVLSRRCHLVHREWIEDRVASRHRSATPGDDRYSPISFGKRFLSDAWKARRAGRLLRSPGRNHRARLLAERVGPHFVTHIEGDVPAVKERRAEIKSVLRRQRGRARSGRLPGASTVSPRRQRYGARTVGRGRSSRRLRLARGRSNHGEQRRGNHDIAVGRKRGGFASPRVSRGTRTRFRLFTKGKCPFVLVPLRM